MLQFNQRVQIELKQKNLSFVSKPCFFNNTMSICEEKILKLNERMDQPLPSYHQSQINRTRKIYLERNFREEVNQNIAEKQIPMSKVGSMSRIERSQKMELNEGLLQNSYQISQKTAQNVSGQKMSLLQQMEKKTDKKQRQENQKDQKKMSSKKSHAFFQCSPSWAYHPLFQHYGLPGDSSVQQNMLNGIDKKSSNSSNSKFDIAFLNQLKPQKNKITDYFKFNSQNQKKSQLFNSFDELNYLQYQSAKEQTKQDKISSLKYDLLIQDKNKEIAHLHQLLQQREQSFTFYKEKLKKFFSPVLLESAQYNRDNKIKKLQKFKRKIGQFATERGTISPQWIDGQKIQKLTQKLLKIRTSKDKVDKIKKKIKKLKKNQNSKNDEISKQSIYALSDYSQSFDLAEDNLEEHQQRLSYQQQFLQKEESKIQEQINGLKQKASQYYQLQKQIEEEEQCRFARDNEDHNWPVLNERYQVIELLGKGGFSEVYKAFDFIELRYVACKIHQLNQNWKKIVRSNYVKHAIRENQVMQRISHVNIVQRYDSVEIDAESFGTILEYCDGLDLATYLKRQGNLSEKESKQIIKQVLNGLKFLNQQEQKIIHYDLKPQNILFSNGVVKISDFGLCKIMEENDTKLELTSQGVGTYWYLPPECFKFDNPEISTKVDIWSVGVIFYEMLYGRRPFGHNMSQNRILKEGLMLQALNLEFPAKPVVTDKTKQFISKCLEYHQEMRIDIMEAYNLIYKQSNQIYFIINLFNIFFQDFLIINNGLKFRTMETLFRLTFKQQQRQLFIKQSIKTWLSF